MVFISATVNGIVRLNSATDESIKGLCTENLRVCWAIIIYHKSNAKISLIHFNYNKTPLDCIGTEVSWVSGGDAAATCIDFVTNSTHFNENPQLVDNLLEEKYHIFELFSKLRVTTITEASSDAAGSVAIDRHSYQLVSMTEAVLNYPYYYRTAINHVSGGFIQDGTCLRANADLQYDCNCWTKLPFISNGALTFSEISILETTSECQTEAILRSFKTIKLARNFPRAFMSEEEFDAYITKISAVYIGYFRSKRLYIKSKEMGYTMIAPLTAKQRQVIHSLDGEIMFEAVEYPGSALSVILVNIPSRLLTKEYRQILRIDRMRICRDVAEIEAAEGLLHSCLNGVVLGWKLENEIDDIKGLGKLLLTWPYKDEAHWKAMREKVDAMAKQL